MSLEEWLEDLNQDLVKAMDTLEKVVEFVNKSEISSNFGAKASFEKEFYKTKQSYNTLMQTFVLISQKIDSTVFSRLDDIKKGIEILKSKISSKIAEFDSYVSLLDGTYEIYKNNLPCFCDGNCMFCSSIPSIFVNASKYHRVCTNHIQIPKNPSICVHCNTLVDLTYLCSSCNNISQDLTTLRCNHRLCRKHINSHDPSNCHPSEQSNSNLNRTLDPPNSAASKRNRSNKN